MLRLKIGLIIIVSFHSVFGQQVNTSPFSRYGVGEINNVISASYLGFSNSSIAFSDPQFINISNPASYSRMRKYNPLFDVTISGKTANYNSNYNGNLNSSSGTNLGLNNMYLGLPISQKWGAVLGVNTYSSQGYEVSSTISIDSSQVTNVFKGDGTVNRLFIGTGLDLVNRGDSVTFSIGGNASYMFGNLERLSSVVFNNSNTYNSRIQYRSSISGWLFDGGVQFMKRITSRKKNKIYLRMGAHYSLGAEWQTSNDYFAYTFTYNFGVQEIPKDTLSSQENLDGNFSIPEKMTFGVGIGKNKQDRSSWDLAFQYEIRDWTTFQETNSIESWTSPQLGNSEKMSFGFRWTPNLDFANTNKSIFSKSTYSIGGHQSKSYILMDEINLDHYGINFGLTVPLLSSRSFSTMNLGMELGKLGDLNNVNIEENYINFAIGFTMAPDTRYDRWFRKRQYD
ncbi:MAG: hypothetical protein VYE38_07310 [Bacteroidota bacterium]|nr:hypothetical protein [Bacteroidota bacterium]MEC7814614.1 hypothetical protein [Bacteroidota bacterium]